MTNAEISSLGRPGGWAPRPDRSGRSTDRNVPTSSAAAEPLLAGAAPAAGPARGPSAVRIVIGRRAAVAGGRLARHRRRRRDAVRLNDRAAELAGVAALLAWAGALLAGYPAFRFEGAFAALVVCGLVTGAAWGVLHLLTRQMEQGRCLAVHAAFWSVFSPFRRDAARRARRLRREAIALRRTGSFVV